MEEECHELDLELAQTTLDVGSMVFDQYRSNLRQLAQLKEEHDKQSQVITLLEQMCTYAALTLQQTNPALKRGRDEVATLRKKLQETV